MHSDQQYRRFLAALHAINTLCCQYFLNFRHSSKFVVTVHVWLCLHFIKSKWCLTSFHVVIYHSYIFCEMSFYVFCPFSTWSVCIFFCSVLRVFYIHQTKVICLIWFANITSWSLACFFILLVLFTEQRFLIFTKSKLSDFNFMDYTFGDMSKIWITPGHEYLLLYFLLYILYLYQWFLIRSNFVWFTKFWFISMIDFELILFFPALFGYKLLINFVQGGSLS